MTATATGSVSRMQDLEIIHTKSKTKQLRAFRDFNCIRDQCNTENRGHSQWCERTRLFKAGIIHRIFAKSGIYFAFY
jgi:hypothetical protein